MGSRWRKSSTRCRTDAGGIGLCLRRFCARSGRACRSITSSSRCGVADAGGRRSVCGASTANSNAATAASSNSWRIGLDTPRPDRPGAHSRRAFSSRPEGHGAATAARPFLPGSAPSPRSDAIRPFLGTPHDHRRRCHAAARCGADRLDEGSQPEDRNQVAVCGVIAPTAAQWHTARLQSRQRRVDRVGRP